MKHLLPIFCFFYACISVVAETAPDQSVRTRLYWVLPDIFPEEDTKSLPQQMSNLPCELQFDVRKYFIRNGVELLSHEEAIYQPSSRVLVVRARVKILDLVQTTLGSICCFPGNQVPSCVRVEADLIEFSPAKEAELNGEVSYEEVRKAAGDSWHVLNRTVVMTRPDERTLVISKIGQQGKSDIASSTNQVKEDDKGGSLLGGESGATLEVRPSIAPEGRTATVDLAYHYRGYGPEALNWEATTAAAVNLGVPRVLQLNTAPAAADSAKPARLRALILRVDAIYDYGADPKLGTQAVSPAARPAPRP